MFIPKNIAITVGHSILKNGAITSADGRKHGGVIEYEWCKKFSPILAEEFRNQGCKAIVIQCPERVFTKAYEEKKYKLERINGKGYDLVIENHLNASNGNARGTETLYSKRSTKGKEVAQRANDKIDDIYKDRGIKARTDLYILTQTQPVAILNEYFFCDSIEDYKLSDEECEMRLIARKVVEGVLNKTIEDKTSQGSSSVAFKNGDYSTKKARVIVDGLRVRYDRGTNFGVIDKLKKNDIVKLQYCLNGWISIEGHKGNKGLGYVSTNYLELI